MNGGPSNEDPVDPTAARLVLHVAKTHLDVGFTDSAAAVRRRYLEDFFPRAMRVGAQLRATGGPARLRWTTGSWILTEALDAGDASQRRRLEDAIVNGDLCWHALPFTMHTEYAERSLVEHGVSLSAELDRRFDRHTRAAKVTDVPGHTRALVSVLADAGVDLLHVGVNPAAAAPAVPCQFRWCDPARSDRPQVAVMYQPGGYGDVQVVNGTDVAVSIDLTGDNLGPRHADEVVAAFAALADRFPGAEVRAATLDDVAEVMVGAGEHLPVLTAEIGDSWIHGVGSDPQKTAAFRALSRTRRRWLDEGRIDADDPGLRRASTRLLLVAEHTWGLDQKTHWPDTTHWSEQDLARVRADPATTRFESSWAEQRHLLDEFVDVLDAAGHHDLAAEAADAVRASAAQPSAVRVAAERTIAERTIAPAPTPVDELRPCTAGTAVGLGAWALQVDHTGAVVHCTGPVGQDLASSDEPLFQVHQQTYDATDYERWYGTYNASATPEDEWWARWDNTKPGLEHTTAVSARWTPDLVGLRSGEDEHGHVVVIDQRIPANVAAPVAVPELFRTTIRAAGTGVLHAELCWFGVRAARWPGATWWRVAPIVSDPSTWTMTKLGEAVSPFDVVAGGGRRLHVAERLDHPDGVHVDLVDTGLVSPGAPRLLVWDDTPIDLASGWHVCLLANLWGTNFPMWNEGDGRCRVTLRLSAGE